MFVKPKVYLVGYTYPDPDLLEQFLLETDNMKFVEDQRDAMLDGITGMETLVSMYAKLCYRSLDPKHNVNLKGARGIADNLKAVMDHAHGSVFEHVSLNFVVTNCSRVFTHQMVRHRVGTAYSQTSGMYCRTSPGKLDFVLDPVLEPVSSIITDHISHTERAVYLMECAYGLRAPTDQAGHSTEPCDNMHAILAGAEHSWIAYISSDFDESLLWPVSHAIPYARRKLLTSAIRRVVPEAQSNELGMTINLRTLRQLVPLRTERTNEWEIREVFSQIYDICDLEFPTLFGDAQVHFVDGIKEVTGMRLQPTEKRLADYTLEEITEELQRRAPHYDTDSLLP